MDNFTDEERKTIIGALWKQMSPVSHQTLLKFQNTWDSSRSFLEFRVEQNKKIKECVKLETSFIGDAVRKATGLFPIRLDMEINI